MVQILAVAQRPPTVILLYCHALFLVILWEGTLLRLGEVRAFHDPSIYSITVGENMHM
jgi:hypothetical protein